MGGLSAGIALKRLGHQVTVYEKVTEIKPVGAAISVWSNGVKCLNYLGLTEPTAALGGQMDHMAYVDGLSGRTMTQFSLQPLVEQVGQRPYPVFICVGHWSPERGYGVGMSQSCLVVSLPSDGLCGLEWMVTSGPFALDLAPH